MRRIWLWISAVILLALAYQAWPLVGVSELAGAVRRSDTQDLLARLDLPALRKGVTRQIVRAYLDKTGRVREPTERSLAINLGTSIAEPYVAELLTPEALASLLRKGRLPTKGEAQTLLSSASFPSFQSLLDSGLWNLFMNAHFDGWTAYVIDVPGKTSDDDLALHLQLSGLTWQLAGVDLPKPVVDRIVEEIVARHKEQ